MTGLQIIPVTNMDLVYSVSTLAEEIWRDHFTPIIGQAQVDYMLEKFLSPDALVTQIHSGYEYFLLSYEYTYTGFVGIHEEHNSLFLSKLYVHKDFRGKKIASYMFQQLIELCRLRGLSRIWLTCNRHNADTLAIYDHLGFQKIREEAADIGNGFVMDDYILEYIIS